MTNEEEFNGIEQEPQPQDAEDSLAASSQAAADADLTTEEQNAPEESPAGEDIGLPSETADEVADAQAQDAPEEAADEVAEPEAPDAPEESLDEEDTGLTSETPDEIADAEVQDAPEESADEVADAGASEDAAPEDEEHTLPGSAPDMPEPEPESKPENPLAAARSPSEADDDRAWYVVHCYSGYENKVRYNLEQRIETMGMKDMIFDVVIPTQEEIEVREGKRRSIERHVFPGYILVNLILTDESWFVVRNTPGVTGFVGMGTEPTALRPEEVSQILKRMEADAPHMKVTFRSGERVRIVDGPFNDFRGTVADLDMDRAKVTVMVNFFGRETPVELDFLQVEKA